MKKEDLQDFEKQVRIELQKHIKNMDTFDHTGVVVTTTNTPNNRIFIRFYVLFFMFEKEYLIGEQTPQQVASQFTYDLSQELYDKIYSHRRSN